MSEFENRPPEEEREKEEKKTYYYSRQNDGSFGESTPPSPEKRTDTLAIVSLTLGILGLLCCGWPTGIAALVCALVDRSRRCGFEGLGLAGFILGIIACVMTIASYIFSLVVYGTLLPDLEKILTEMEMEMLFTFRFF